MIINLGIQLVKLRTHNTMHTALALPLILVKALDEDFSKRVISNFIFILILASFCN